MIQDVEDAGRRIEGTTFISPGVQPIQRGGIRDSGVREGRGNPIEHDHNVPVVVQAIAVVGLARAGRQVGVKSKCALRRAKQGVQQWRAESHSGPCGNTRDCAYRERPDSGRH